jgi:hypothetical protein
MNKSTFDVNRKHIQLGQGKVLSVHLKEVERSVGGKIIFSPLEGMMVKLYFASILL